MARTYGVYTRNIVQVGKETVPGTGVAADTIWRGAFAMPEDDEAAVKVLEEVVGSLYNESEQVYELIPVHRFSLPETDMLFEQMAIVLDAGIQAATPSGAGPYVRTYNDVPGTVNTPSTWTIEAGNKDVPDDTQELNMGVVSEFTMSAEANAAWRLSSSWMGKTLAQSALTGSLSLPSVTVATLPMTKLYIDASSGTVGTTQYSGVLMGASLNRKSGFAPVMVGDGTLAFSAYKQTAPEATFSLTIELEKDSSSLASLERAAWHAHSIRQFQLELLSSGTTACQIQWAGRYSKIGTYENREGNTVLTLEGRVVNLPTKSLFMKFIHTCGVAVL